VQQGDGPQIDINLSVHGNRIARVMAFLRRWETRPRSQLFASRGSRAATGRRRFLRRLAPPPLATPELNRNGDGRDQSLLRNPLTLPERSSAARFVSHVSICPRPADVQFLLLFSLLLLFLFAKHLVKSVGSLLASSRSSLLSRQIAYE
jgi:hypothetical protein